MTDISTVNHLARRIEDVESLRLGIRVPQARARIASRLGVSPGTLENFRRLRTKVVPSWLMNKLRAEFVAVLQSEISRLEHEIQLSRQTGMDPRDDVLAAAQAQLAAAKEILRT